MIKFSDLQGLTLTSVERIDDEEIIFRTADRTFRMSHEQDCCESVTIESIVGDLSDLVGTPILLAKESTNAADPVGDYEIEYRDDSQTWTFYRLRTILGSVDIRWYGTSNGYYSESVDFVEVK